MESVTRGGVGIKGVGWISRCGVDIKMRSQRAESVTWCGVRVIGCRRYDVWEIIIKLDDIVSRRPYSESTRCVLGARHVLISMGRILISM